MMTDGEREAFMQGADLVLSSVREVLVARPNATGAEILATIDAEFPDGLLGRAVREGLV